MDLRILSVRIQVGSTSRQSSAGMGVDILLAALGQGALARPPAHFRLFFQLESSGNRAQSIEINSTLEGAPPELARQKKTVLRITYRNYPSSNGAEVSAGRMIDYVSADIPIQSSPRNPALVGSLIHLLLHRGRHRYKLHAASGSGCRHFCATVLRDCCDAGWLHRSYLNVVEDMTNHLRAQPVWQHVDLPFPAPLGEFYPWPNN